MLEETHDCITPHNTRSHQAYYYTFNNYLSVVRVEVNPEPIL